MKILIADDQQLVTFSLEKSLKDIGYEVVIASDVEQTLSAYENHKPDMVIVDLNMPVSLTEDYAINKNSSIDEAYGLEVVRHIKHIKQDAIPVMILSGNTSEDVILKGYEYGVEDYMKKPLSLGEVAARIKRLIGAPVTNQSSKDSNRYIQNNCVGVVIPCYNEESRILSEEFKRFVHSNLGYHLCFVNDGSTDNTLEVLKELAKGKEEYISVYDCSKNGGKAEAVRLGMLHLAKQKQFNFIGFLDADLSTNFKDFDDLVQTISNSEYKIVSGSRISRMGADIAKDSARAIISKTINYFIRKTLGMEFMDTQCGAKIMSKDVVENTFQNKFLTKWLFDVEILMRMKKIYGKDQVQQYLCEQPLNRWEHVDGSKISFRDSMSIVAQIGQIAIHYNK